MAREEKSLAPAEVVQARTALAAARGRQRLNVILDARDPGALVRALPADELYFTIREIGLADAAPLVPLASLEQFRTFLDLDAWRGGQLDPRRALLWLRAARSGAAHDPKSAARWKRKLNGIDRELFFFVLRESVVVHELEEGKDLDVHSDRVVRTPDGRYAVEFLPDGAEYSALRGLLDDLYAEDPFQAGRLLGSLKWEAPSELEESALRWRQGRLADLGIPPLEEALSWFARPPRTPAPAGSEAEPGLPERPPGFWLASLASGSLLDRGADALDPLDRPALEGQLVAAANAVLVADQVDVADPDAVRASFQAARALLELGLTARLRAEGRPLEGAAAAEVLRDVPAKRLFQEGFGRVLELKFRAERLVKGGGAGTREAPLLDAPLGEALFALVAKRPRYSPGLEAPREEWATLAAASYAPRPFLSEAELARTAAALDQCEGLLGLARNLGLAVSLPGTPPPRLTAIYLTALANERLGRAFAPAPMRAGELERAVRALTAAPPEPVVESPARPEPVEGRAVIEDPRLAGAGAPGALLLELSRARAAELARLADAGELRPERVTELVVQA
jgi:hypothetical protein